MSGGRPKSSAQSTIDADKKDSKKGEKKPESKLISKLPREMFFSYSNKASGILSFLDNNDAAQFSRALAKTSSPDTKIIIYTNFVNRMDGERLISEINETIKIKKCNLSLIMSPEKDAAGSQKVIEDAKYSNTPILIKRDKEFSLYSFQKGVWQETKLLDLSKKELDALNQLSFKENKESTILNKDLNNELIQVLKRNHDPYDIKKLNISMNAFMKNLEKEKKASKQKNDEETKEELNKKNDDKKEQIPNPLPPQHSAWSLFAYQALQYKNRAALDLIYKNNPEFEEKDVFINKMIARAFEEKIGDEKTILATLKELRQYPNGVSKKHWIQPLYRNFIKHASEVTRQNDIKVMIEDAFSAKENPSQKYYPDYIRSIVSAGMSISDKAKLIVFLSKFNPDKNKELATNMLRALLNLPNEDDKITPVQENKLTPADQLKLKGAYSVIKKTWHRTQPDEMWTQVDDMFVKNAFTDAGFLMTGGPCWQEYIVRNRHGNKNVDKAIEFSFVAYMNLIKKLKEYIDALPKNSRHLFVKSAPNLKSAETLHTILDGLENRVLYAQKTEGAMFQPPIWQLYQDLMSAMMGYNCELDRKKSVRYLKEFKDLLFELSGVKADGKGIKYTREYIQDIFFPAYLHKQVELAANPDKKPDPKKDHKK